MRAQRTFRSMVTLPSSLHSFSGDVAHQKDVCCATAGGTWSRSGDADRRNPLSPLSFAAQHCRPKVLLALRADSFREMPRTRGRAVACRSQRGRGSNAPEHAQPRGAMRRSRLVAPAGTGGGRRAGGADETRGQRIFLFECFVSPSRAGSQNWSWGLGSLLVTRYSLLVFIWIRVALHTWVLGSLRVASGCTQLFWRRYA